MTGVLSEGGVGVPDGKTLDVLMLAATIKTGAGGSPGDWDVVIIAQKSDGAVTDLFSMDDMDPNTIVHADEVWDGATPLASFEGPCSVSFGWRNVGTNPGALASYAHSVTAYCQLRPT